MVLYGIMTNTDISKLFIAGILPGLLGVLLYVLTISILTRLRPGIGPPSDLASWTARWRSVAAVWEVVLLFVLVIGGIYAGAFTPTEAAGVGAGGALLAAILRRRIGVRAVGEALYETARMTAGIFLILVGALVFSNFLNMTPLPKALAGLAVDFGTHPLLIVVCISMIYVLLGCILDSISMILLTIPLFFPVVKEAGVDPIWFGVLVVVVTEISLITPPIGMNIFVLNATRDRRPHLHNLPGRHALRPCGCLSPWADDRFSRDRDGPAVADVSRGAYTTGQRETGLTLARSISFGASSRQRAWTSARSMVASSRFSIRILPSTITVSTLSPLAE